MLIKTFSNHATWRKRMIKIRYNNESFTRSNNKIYLDPVLDKLEESLVDEGRFLDSPELDAMLPTWAVIELGGIILKIKLKTFINNWSHWNCNFCKNCYCNWNGEKQLIEHFYFRIKWRAFHSCFINTCLNLWEIEYVLYLPLFS